MEGREGVSSSGGDITADAQPLAVVLAQTPPTAAAAGALPLKKKRGRPRKYAPDGSVNVPLSPKPVSSSAPLPVIDFSSHKRGKVRSAGSWSKPKFQIDNLGEWLPCSGGTNFTPHIITVNPGEDVMMKVISFSQQGGPRAICILSANGVISSVTFRQPDSSGGTLTYEGRFEILSLSGSFMLSETEGTRSRSGGMSVSLSSPDGRVVGGVVAGLLVAAGLVQVVVGSFMTGKQPEQNPGKKQKDETLSTPNNVSATRDYNGNSTLLKVDHWSGSIAPQDAANKLNISFVDVNNT